MLVLVKANVLAVGLAGKGDVLKRLPIRVLYIQTGRQAGRSLKNENVSGVISKWNLPDAPDGRFLRNLCSARPYLPVIAVVDSGDVQQEISARSIGVSAVLSSDVSNRMFRRILVEVLGLGDTGEIEKIGAVADDSENRRV